MINFITEICYCICYAHLIWGYIISLY